MTSLSPRFKLLIGFLNFPKDCILHKIRHTGAFALLEQFLVHRLTSFTFKLHFPQGSILRAPTFSLTMLFIKLSYLLIISIFNTFAQGKVRFIDHRLTTSKSSTIQSVTVEYIFVRYSCIYQFMLMGNILFIS